MVLLNHKDMIGLVIVLFIPALICFIAVSLYINKRKAKSLANAIEENITNNYTYTLALLKKINETLTCDLENSFIPRDASVYIIKPNTRPKIHTVNKNIEREFPEHKFKELINKTQYNRILAECTIDSYSVYFIYEDKKSILLITGGNSLVNYK